MKYAVEVAHLLNGELVSVRRLSTRRERYGAWLAAAIVSGGFLGGMMAVLGVVRALGRAVYAPEFLGLWLGLGVLSVVFAYVSVSRRLRRYRLGTRLDADGFAPFELDLVRRVTRGSIFRQTKAASTDLADAGEEFELRVTAGMQGFVENGRAPLPIEALVSAGSGARTVPLARDAHAEVRVGPSVFAVRSVPLAAGGHRDVPRDLWRSFSRVAVGGLEVALVGTLLSLIPPAQTIGDRPQRAAGPRITTPWEAEKRLRMEAQEQAASLHQCFDPLPLSCQHSGYVGVGVSLNRDGELRSNWIARSTYGRECPVDQCMKDVVSTWIFDPLPEAMRVVLPVQVLRTEKPLPPKVAKAEPAAEVGGGDLAVEWTRDGR